MKNFIKIFSAIVGMITGIGLLVWGIFSLLLWVVEFNQWLMIPILIIIFAFWGTMFILPFYDN